MEVAGKNKSKTERDEERDISEKIALGQAQPTSKEAMFDQRLFNQTSGLDTGFGHDDDYNIYDKPLFTDRTQASIYKGIKEPEPDDEGEAAPKDVKKILSQKPNRGFEGTDYTQGGERSKPVEFEKKKLDTDLADFGEAGLQGNAKRQKRE